MLKEEIKGLVGKKCWFAGSVLEIRKSSDAEIVSVEENDVVIKHFLGHINKIPISAITSIRRKDIAGKPYTEDIKPNHGPSTYSFMLSDLKNVRLKDWPLPNAKNFGWRKAEIEVIRHWDILLSKKFWSPYPIVAYCIGSAEGPVDDNNLSEEERIVQKVLNEQYAESSNKAKIRYFLFPTNTPTGQNQVVAQIVCETIIGAKPGDIEVWVDALRKEELTQENINDINYALSKTK